MGILSNILAEKKGARRQHLAAAEVLAMQINNSETRFRSRSSPPFGWTHYKGCFKLLK